MSACIIQLRKKPVWLSILATIVVSGAIGCLAEVPTGAIKLSPSGTQIQIDATEPSYVQYAANDLASYLQEIGKAKIAVSSKSISPPKKTVIVIGRAMARQFGEATDVTAELGLEGYVIRFVQDGSTSRIIVAGYDPHGTNAAIAALIQLIQADADMPYLASPLEVRSKPSYALRGIHLNGWPLNYPYAFRSWKEEDWKRFVDIAWAQKINLFYLWPFMEILPVPLSKEDESYLREVQRVVDYAKNKRGMQVWIMQSANRIGTSDCGVPDPRTRPYWVNDCQKDMNPADPKQFERILTSFEAFYKIVNNADAYCMIDSDPGGWPQSPVSDQVKIFQGARKLLDQYSLGRSETKLVDWMHVGWGRHKFFTSTDSVVAAYDWTEKNPDESDVAFMGETIRYFKQHLHEPWRLIAGQPPYLSVVQKEQVLDRAVYLPYGAIEHEPAFPATNLGQESVRQVFDKAKQYPGLLGVMGNNQLMLLQFPRTFYFFQTAWNREYENRSEPEALLDLATQLYPEHAQLVADSFLALRSVDVSRISTALNGLDTLLQKKDAGHAGGLGRLLFPDHLAIIRSLAMQLEIRAARQSLLKGLQDKPDIAECSALVENYLEKLLAWNKETGWDKMIGITVWPRPIYEGGKDFTEALYRLKQLLAQGAPYTSYAKVNAFFETITKNLLARYDQDSVMVGCIDPLKVAVLQSQ